MFYQENLLKAANRNIEKLRAELDLWKSYASELEHYHSRVQRDDFESDMARAMARPNKPGYYRANND
jgi:hypothetical protein